MNKIYTFFLTTFITLFISLSLQGQYFEKDKSYIGIGRAFPVPFNEVTAALDLLADEKVYSVGPIFVNYELGLHKYVGVFIQGKVASSKYAIDLIGDREEFKFLSLGVDARVVGHYPDVEKIDPYVALGISYNASIYEISGVKIPEDSPSSVMAALGVKFHFDDRFAAFLEFATGVSPFSIGVNFKI